METQFRIRASRTPMYLGGGQIQLFAYQSGSGGHYAAKKLELVQHEQNSAIEPFIDIDKEEAQVLMDDLWDAGVRPTEGSGSAGAMKAVQDHLADMKRIAFHALKMEK